MVRVFPEEDGLHGRGRRQSGGEEEARRAAPPVQPRHLRQADADEGREERRHHGEIVRMEKFRDAEVDAHGDHGAAPEQNGGEQPAPALLVFFVRPEKQNQKNGDGKQAERQKPAVLPAERRVEHPQGAGAAAAVEHAVPGSAPAARGHSAAFLRAPARAPGSAAGEGGGRTAGRRLFRGRGAESGAAAPHLPENALDAVVLQRQFQLRIGGAVVDVGPLVRGRQVHRRGPGEGDRREDQRRRHKPQDALLPAQVRRKEIDGDQRGQNQKSLQRLGVVGDAEKHHRKHQPARLSRLGRRRHGPDGADHEENQDGIRIVGFADEDENRRKREDEGGNQPRGLAEAPPDRSVENQDRSDRGDAVGQDDAPAVEAEHLGEGGLNPQRDRRLVDRDPAARVQRDEEEILPARQHAFDGSGVKLIAVAEIPDIENGQERGQA